METERQLQERVKRWLINDLHYEFLGNFENINNSCIIKNSLKKNLISRNYSPNVIKKAIADFENILENQNFSLYHINEKMYNLLRYGDMGIKDKDSHDVTVLIISTGKILIKMTSTLPRKFQFYAPMEKLINVPI